MVLVDHNKFYLLYKHIIKYQIIKIIKKYNKFIIYQVKYMKKVNFNQLIDKNLNIFIIYQQN